VIAILFTWPAPITAYTWNSQTLCVPCAAAGARFTFGTESQLNRYSYEYDARAFIEELRRLKDEAGCRATRDASHFPQPVHPGLTGAPVRCARCAATLGDTRHGPYPHAP
jgi:hypothetical protein